MRFKNLGFIAACLVGLMILLAQLFAVGSHRPHPLAIDRSPDATLPVVVADLDRQFLNHWQQFDLKAAHQADEWTIIRRLSLALTGTIPSLEKLRMLQQLDATERVDTWVDHLLADRRFSDYLAERFARIYVGIEEGPFLVYRRRRFVSWLSDELHANRPYDELVRELISGRGIWTDSPSVNFLTVTNDVNGDEQPDEERLAARTARAFLGIRLDCVQCHDDNLGGDWLQYDFQQLAAFFAEANSSLLGIQDKTQEYEFQYLGSDQSEVVPAEVPFGDGLFDAAQGSRRQQLAAWVTHPQNKAFSRAIVNRLWALMFGKPLMTPIDDLPLQGPFPPGLQLLADDFSTTGYDLRRLIRLIARSQPFRVASQSVDDINEREESHWAVFPLTRLRPEQVARSVLQAASLRTIGDSSHILVQLARHELQKDFVGRYGDNGEDEFNDRGGTIPQRLLLMNGELVRERTKDDLVNNSVTRIALLVGDDQRAIDSAYWIALTRPPTEPERQYFLFRLKGCQDSARREVLEDLCWALFNSTEFSWNH